MKIIIPLLICGLSFASYEGRALFSSEELKAIEKLKSDEYLLHKYNVDLQKKAKFVFDFSLKKDRDYLKKKLKIKNGKFFENLERKQLYESMFKKFLEE